MNKNLMIGGAVLLLVVILVVWLMMRGDVISLSVTVKGENGTPIGNVKVSIASQSQSQTTDAQGSAVFSLRVKAGESFAVIAEGQGQSKTVNLKIEKEDITEKSADVSIVFASEKPKTGWIRVISRQPSGIAVSIDDAPQGLAPLVAAAPAGHTAMIHVSKKGYHSRDTSITVSTDTSLWVAALIKNNPNPGPIKPPSAKMGSLLIKSTPPGAKVKIDGVDERDATPMTKKLEYGVHTVEAALNGKAEHKEIDLENSSIEVAFTLPSSRLQSAKLLLKSIPSGAKIKLNGQEIAQVTPATLDVPFGDHTIELSAGGKTQTQTVHMDNEYLVRTVVIGDCIERVKQAESRMAEVVTTKRESTYVDVDQILSSCDSASVTVDMFRKALYYRGVANYNLRNFGTAIDYFQKLALKYDKTNPLVYYYLGLTYEKSRRYFDAINSFNEIERHKTFLAPDRREDILGESVFSVGNDYYLLSTQTEDPDLKAQLQDAALQNLSEFVSDYCSGTTKSHQRCDRANQIIHDLEK